MLELVPLQADDAGYLSATLGTSQQLWAQVFRGDDHREVGLTVALAAISPHVSSNNTASSRQVMHLCSVVQPSDPQSKQQGGGVAPLALELHLPKSSSHAQPIGVFVSDHTFVLVHPAEPNRLHVFAVASPYGARSNDEEHTAAWTFRGIAKAFEAEHLLAGVSLRFLEAKPILAVHMSPSVTRGERAEACVVLLCRGERGKAQPPRGANVDMSYKLCTAALVDNDLDDKAAQRGGGGITALEVVRCVSCSFSERLPDVACQFLELHRGGDWILASDGESAFACTVAQARRDGGGVKAVTGLSPSTKIACVQKLESSATAYQLAVLRGNDWVMYETHDDVCADEALCECVAFIALGAHGSRSASATVVAIRTVDGLGKGKTVLSAPPRNRGGKWLGTSRGAVPLESTVTSVCEKWSVACSEAIITRGLCNNSDDSADESFSLLFQSVCSSANSIAFLRDCQEDVERDPAEASLTPADALLHWRTNWERTRASLSDALLVQQVEALSLSVTTLLQRLDDLGAVEHITHVAWAAVGVTSASTVNSGGSHWNLPMECPRIFFDDADIVPEGLVQLYQVLLSWLCHRGSSTNTDGGTLDCSDNLGLIWQQVTEGQTVVCPDTSASIQRLCLASASLLALGASRDFLRRLLPHQRRDDTAPCGNPTALQMLATVLHGVDDDECADVAGLSASQRWRTFLEHLEWREVVSEFPWCALEPLYRLRVLRKILLCTAQPEQHSAHVRFVVDALIAISESCGELCHTSAMAWLRALSTDCSDSHPSTSGLVRGAQHLVQCASSGSYCCWLSRMDAPHVALTCGSILVNLLDSCASPNASQVRNVLCRFLDALWHEGVEIRLLSSVEAMLDLRGGVPPATFDTLMHHVLSKTCANSWNASVLNDPARIASLRSRMCDEGLGCAVFAAFLRLLEPCVVQEGARRCPWTVRSLWTVSILYRALPSPKGDLYTSSSHLSLHLAYALASDLIRTPQVAALCSGHVNLLRAECAYLLGHRDAWALHAPQPFPGAFSFALLDFVQCLVPSETGASALVDDSDEGWRLAARVAAQTMEDALGEWSSEGIEDHREDTLDVSSHCETLMRECRSQLDCIDFDGLLPQQVREAVEVVSAAAWLGKLPSAILVASRSSGSAFSSAFVSLFTTSTTSTEARGLIVSLLERVVAANRDASPVASILSDALGVMSAVADTPTCIVSAQRALTTAAPGSASGSFKRLSSGAVNTLLIALRQQATHRTEKECAAAVGTPCPPPPQDSLILRPTVPGAPRGLVLPSQSVVKAEREERSITEATEAFERRALEENFLGTVWPTTTLFYVQASVRPTLWREWCAELLRCCESVELVRRTEIRRQQLDLMTTIVELMQRDLARLLLELQAQESARREYLSCAADNSTKGFLLRMAGPLQLGLTEIACRFAIQEDQSTGRLAVNREFMLTLAEVEASALRKQQRKALEVKRFLTATLRAHVQDVVECWVSTTLSVHKDAAALLAHACAHEQEQCWHQMVKECQALEACPSQLLLGSQDDRKDGWEGSDLDLDGDGNCPAPLGSSEVVGGWEEDDLEFDAAPEVNAPLSVGVEAPLRVPLQEVEQAPATDRAATAEAECKRHEIEFAQDEHMRRDEERQAIPRREVVCRRQQEQQAEEAHRERVRDAAARHAAQAQAERELQCASLLRQESVEREHVEQSAEQGLPIERERQERSEAQQREAERIAAQRAAEQERADAERRLQEERIQHKFLRRHEAEADEESTERVLLNAAVATVPNAGGWDEDDDLELPTVPNDGWAEDDDDLFESDFFDKRTSADPHTSTISKLAGETVSLLWRELVDEREAFECEEVAAAVRLKRQMDMAIARCRR